MAPGETYKLRENAYSSKHDKKGNPILLAEKGTPVKIISVSHETVIVEKEPGNRFSVHKSKL